MKRFVPLAIALVVVVAFVGTLVFLYNKSQAAPVHFETASAAVADLVKKTVATGSIVPRREVEIKPRVSGVVEKLYLQAGQMVKDGQEIALIKIIPNVVTLNAAEAQVSTAQISFEAARKELADILGVKVLLFLHVKVEAGWDETREFYDDIGLDWVK